MGDFEHFDIDFLKKNSHKNMIEEIEDKVPKLLHQYYFDSNFDIVRIELYS